MNFNIIEIAGAIVAEVNRHSVQQRERRNIRREQEGHVNSLWRKREEKKLQLQSKLLVLVLLLVVLLIIIILLMVLLAVLVVATWREQIYNKLVQENGWD